MPDTGFRPSRDGFGFPNAWRDTLLGVLASRGRCGGMVFSALDHFLANTPLPAEARQRELPAHDSALARLIWRRQAESVVVGLGANLWQFARFTYLPTNAPAGIGEHSRIEMDRVLRSLGEGRPVPLGLVSALTLRHLARNHQVLAYAAEADDERVVLRVYDPNFPLRDDVVIEVPLIASGMIAEYAGSRTIAWRGLFVERYAPLAPVAPGVPMTERAPDTRVVFGFGLAAIAVVWAFVALLRPRRR